MVSMKNLKEGGQAKLRFDLLPSQPLRAIVRALTHGADKHSPHGWASEPDVREIYWAAMQRHLWAWRAGESKDTGPNGSGNWHLAHAGACLVFLLTAEMKGWIMAGEPDPMEINETQPPTE